MAYVGTEVLGLTNRQLAAGKGNFVADIALPNMAHMAVVRSAHGHARIRGIDTRAAEAVPGVVCVVTGAEIAANTDPIPPAYDTKAMNAKQIETYALAIKKVRYVGEPVAAVVAEDKWTATRAAELIEVDYEVLPAVTDVDSALKAGSALVEESWGDNVLISRDHVMGEPDKAMAAADGTVEGVLQTHRYTGAAIEPRAYLATHDPYTNMTTVWASTQSPHPMRCFLAKTLRMRETDLRVIQPHVGGAFGLKLPTFQEEPLICYLARKLVRPVRWIEERTESLAVGGHAREERIRFKAGYKKDGQITAIDIHILADVGAPSALCGWGMSNVTAFCLPTVYDVKDCHVRLHTVVTNKCPWNAYRGYGKEAATFVMERIMDMVSDKLGIDKAAIRMKNFVPPESFPHRQPSGAMMDSGNYPEVLRRCLELAKWDDLVKERDTARQKGHVTGIGLSYELTPEGGCMPRSTLLSAYDGCTVRMNPEAEVTVLTGVTSPGSGNETGIAQIVADQVGVTIDRVRVVQGDTEVSPWGLGNYSSRSIIMGGSAARIAAGELREKLVDVAARMLEVAPADVELEGNLAKVRGAPARSVALATVAETIYTDCFGRQACQVEPGLEATRYFRHQNIDHQPKVASQPNLYPTWPNGAYVAVVDVDPDTGKVTVKRMVCIHDTGNMINPLMVDANMHGGIAQGLGGVLYEHLVYDTEGQLLTGTFMDYTCPTAADLPGFEIGHVVTPSPFNPLGAKGAGESGVGGPLDAVVSAVEDALKPLGVKEHLLETPLTPARVWRLIQTAQAS
ncbi:MAG: xanthine dehydrogenase family protein molybdopterin-binding subunit [Candidatus Binatia bacterium]